METFRRVAIFIATVAGTLLLFQGMASGQGTAFAYQGQFSDSGSPANGSYDLKFSLYNDPSAGSQVGTSVTNIATTVSNGFFSLTLNFGNVFDGTQYWLEIAAQTNGGGGFAVLTPRQPITAVPYAITAGNALGLTGSLPASQISGTVPLNNLPSSLVTNGATGLNLTGTFTGSGAGLSGIYSSNLTSDVSILSMVESTSPPAPATNWMFYPMSQNSSNFLTIGGTLDSGGNGPGFFDPAFVQTGIGGVPVEFAFAMSETFEMDGSQFAFGIIGQDRIFSILVNGVDNMITNTMPNDGNLYWWTVTFDTAATRTVTLRNAYGFSGVYLPITNGFFLPRPLSARMVVIGDSFTEQTYTTGSQCMGIVSQMQTLLPQFDIWALGEGGTGFVNTGPAGSGRTNFLGRAADIINAAPQYVVIYGGINDISFATDTTCTNPVYMNATNLICTVHAALPSAKIAVIGPQWAADPYLTGVPGLFNCAVLMSNACAVCGVPYISPIAEPWITGNVNVPNSGNANIYTMPAEGTHPTIPAGAKFVANKIVSALSQFWNLNNPATPVFSPTTTSLPATIPAGGVFWNSNNVLYWVTSTRTNYLCGP